jgi:hypothetical protein
MSEVPQPDEKSFVLHHDLPIVLCRIKQLSGCGTTRIFYTIHGGMDEQTSAARIQCMGAALEGQGYQVSSKTRMDGVMILKISW